MAGPVSTNPKNNELGSALVQCAKAPLRKAVSLLTANRISEALEAISHDNILAGIREGTVQVAKRIGATPAEVEQTLPWNELSPILVRITSTQRAAAEVWQKHADTVGGLLIGFAGASVSGASDKQPGPGAYLNSLSARFVRDKHLAIPIKSFATDILAWEGMIERCGDFIDRSDLADRYKRKRLIKLVAAISFVLVIVLGVGVTLGMRIRLANSRARVDQWLSAKDACDVEKIAPEDRENALPEQLKKADERLSECKKKRDREAYEAKCDGLVKHLEAGKLEAADEEDRKPEMVAVLRRIAAGSLKASDFTLSDKDFPCQDVPNVEGRLWAAYATAAANSSEAWADVETVSDRLKKLLAEKGRSLSDASKQKLDQKAEEASKKAIVSGKPDLLARAKALCEFNKTFGVEYGRNCKGVIAATGGQP